MGLLGRFDERNQRAAERANRADPAPSSRWPRLDRFVWRAFEVEAAFWAVLGVVVAVLLAVLFVARVVGVGS